MKALLTYNITATYNGGYGKGSAQCLESLKWD